MKTRPEQFGDVVLEVPASAGQSNIVRRYKRSLVGRTLGLGQLLLAAAGFWLIKVEDSGQVATWLLPPAFALALLNGKWGVKEELWLKPSEPVARAAYRNREIAQNVLWVVLHAALVAYIFGGPAGSGPASAALITFAIAGVALWHWGNSTRDRWLERVPASEAALAIPPPFRY